MSSMMLTELPAEITGLTVGSKYLIQNKSVADCLLVRTREHADRE